MTSTTVTINGIIVPIFADPLINLGLVTNFIPFKTWISNVDPSININKIVIQSVDMFGPRIGFMKYQVFGNVNGIPLPGVVFSRGNSVAVLPVLKLKDTPLRYVICTEQYRMPAGKKMIEIPAGMMDNDDNFVGVAAKEMTEETGIIMNKTDLVELTSDLVFPSIGACDEGMKIMYYTKEVTAEYLEKLNGKLTGSVEENEVIQLKLIPYEDLYNISDMKALSAMLLLERKQSRGIIPY
jgi:ADP-sugar diphosphatase